MNAIREYLTDPYLQGMMKDCLAVFDSSRFSDYIHGGPHAGDFERLFQPGWQKYPNVVMFSVDNWGNDDQTALFRPHGMRDPCVFDEARTVFLDHPQTRFFLISAMFDMDTVFQGIDNVSVLHWGNDMITHPHTKYKNTAPQKHKNFRSDRHWIFLSHNHRMHRNMAALLLLGYGLDRVGHLRFSPGNILDNDSWQGLVNYWVHNDMPEIHDVQSHHDILQRGFDRCLRRDGYHFNVYSGQGPAVGCNMPHDVGWNHARNFDLNLRPLYAESFVEIVGEPVFMMPGITVTEKYLNSVYGFNFPIILSGPGTVAHLRDLGFDMFDDVIDHSYDHESSHMKRLVAAIDLNRRLLEDAVYTKQNWLRCEPRFNHNHALADSMYDAQPGLVIDNLKRLLCSI
jgi:hypothetical protein